MGGDKELVRLALHHWAIGQLSFEKTLQRDLPSEKKL